MFRNSTEAILPCAVPPGNMRMHGLLEWTSNSLGKLSLWEPTTMGRIVPLGVQTLGQLRTPWSWNPGSIVNPLKLARMVIAAPYLVLAHYSMLVRMEIRASMLVLVQPHLATLFYEYQHITIYWLGWRSEPVGC